MLLKPRLTFSVKPSLSIRWTTTPTMLIRITDAVTASETVGIPPDPHQIQ
jgi:hypothetical protein